METGSPDITVELTEHEDCTDARVVAVLGGEQFSGWGRARRQPEHPQVPTVGEGLALARALADLSDHLLDVAAEAIGAQGQRAAVEPQAPALGGELPSARATPARRPQARRAAGGS